MTIEHRNLSGTQLHEPKGVGSATAGHLGFSASNVISWSTPFVQDSQTASTSSELYFQNLGGCLRLRLTIVDLLRATASTTLRMQFSEDNGTTDYSSAEYENWSVDAAGSAIAAGGTSANLNGDNTNLYINGVIEVCNFNTDGIETSWYGQVLCSTSSGGGGTATNQLIWGVMDQGITNDWNALRLFSSSGNLTSGTVYLEGFKGT